jgi:hypothetical protein
MELSSHEQEKISLWPVVKHAFKLSKSCMQVCSIDDWSKGDVTQEDLTCFKGCCALYTEIKDSYKTDFKQFFETTHEFLNERITKE